MAYRMGSSIHLLLVGDHEVLLRGLESVLESQAPDIHVVGKATNAEDASRLNAELKPQIILLDPDFGDSRSVLPRLVGNGEPRLLLYTDIRDTNTHCDAVLLGVRGVLHKSSSAQQLVKAIRCVMAGEVWLDRVSTGQVLTTMLHRTHSRPARVGDARVSRLTRREREIVVAMCAHVDDPAKRVAATLKISDHTLRNHLSTIYDKVGVANRSQLCTFAEQNGLAIPVEQL